MDLKNIFIVVGIALIGLTSFFAFAGDLNSEYGTTLGYNMNETRASLESGIIGNLTIMAGDIGNATLSQEGASEGTGTVGLVTRSLRVLGSIPRLLGFIPAIMRESAGVIGIPPIIVDVGVWLFLITIGLVLMYLFLTGARALLP